LGLGARIEKKDTSSKNGVISNKIDSKLKRNPNSTNIARSDGLQEKKQKTTKLETLEGM